jgi:transcriptional regulator with XRE-family HTH domain
MVVPMIETAAAGHSPMRDARLAKGLTHRKLAELCAAAGQEVSHSQLVRIENAQSSPRPALRAVLAQVLGIDGTQLPE